MIVPVGEPYQQVFHLLKKENGKLQNEALRPTLFVPMTGQGRRDARGAGRPLASHAHQPELRGIDPR